MKKFAAALVLGLGLIVATAIAGEVTAVKSVKAEKTPATTTTSAPAASPAPAK